ncbi:MAG: 2OG-Fe(II) oxygenase family protein [Pseudomonadota bacterium]
MIRTVDYAAPNAAKEFTSSIAESGFAVLQNHPLSGDRLQRMYAGWKAFFDSKEKHNYQVKDLTKENEQYGYFGPDIAETAVGFEQQDIKEYFHADFDMPFPDGLEADARSHCEDAQALAKQLLDWLDAAIPEDCRQAEGVVWSDALSWDDSLLRILHYPPLKGDEPAGSVRAAAHEDINFITLLPVADQPGLQVRTLEGDWLDLEGRQGDLIINTGDMLQEISGGYLPSTTHRVVNPAGQHENISRISIPFFLHPSRETRLSTRYTAGEYLRDRILETYNNE